MLLGKKRNFEMQFILSALRRLYGRSFWPVYLFFSVTYAGLLLVYFFVDATSYRNPSITGWGVRYLPWIFFCGILAASVEHEVKARRAQKKYKKKDIDE
ncbi:MAG: hypothetical protein AAF999_02380 [Pseudomonadota bacterium]